MTDIASETLPITQQPENRENWLQRFASKVPHRQNTASTAVSVQALGQREEVQKSSALRRLRMQLANEQVKSQKSEAIKSARYAAGMQYAREYRAQQLARKSGK